MMRKIDEIIVHCSATPKGKDFSVDDIRKWHKQRGFCDAGYHFVVRIDGRIESGRPIAVAGAHCLGHNSRSIGVCYVGGCSEDGRTPADTRTAAQRESLERFIAELCAQFPGASVHGHCEYAAKACPCFDASAEYSHLQHRS